MTFTGETWVIGLAYTAPIAYLGIRIGVVQNTWLKTETQISNKYTAVGKLDENSPEYKNTIKELSKLEHNNKKRVNKIVRMGIYFLIFGILFFWRPIKIENNPIQTHNLRHSYVDPTYKTDKEWKVTTERFKSLEEQQKESAAQWNKERNNP